MPFEPRVHLPDDFDDDLRAAGMFAAEGEAPGEFSDAAWEAALPPEFSALAEQLAADAAHLAACYPAQVERGLPISDPIVAELAPAAPAVLPAPAFTLAAAGGLVGGIVAAVLFLVSLIGPGNGDPAGRRAPIVAVPGNPSTPTLAEHPQIAQGVEAALRSALLPAPPALMQSGEVPVRALRELSGPELEGLIDLLDAPASDKPSLSI